MREYFRGWRRKAGISTLLVACGLMGLWVRSRIVFDQLAYYTKGSMQRMTSYDSMIWLEDRQAAEGGESRLPSVSFRWKLGLSNVGRYSPYQESSPDAGPRLYRTRIAGFDFGEYRDASGGPSISTATIWRCRVRGIPYWSIALPLTLLSTYLLIPSRKRSTAGQIDA